MSNQRNNQAHLFSPNPGAMLSPRGGSAFSPGPRVPVAVRYGGGAPSSSVGYPHQQISQYPHHQQHPYPNQGVQSNYDPHGSVYGDAGASLAGFTTLPSHQDPNSQIGETASCPIAAELRSKAPTGSWARTLTAALDYRDSETASILVLDNPDIKTSLSELLKGELTSRGQMDDVQSCYSKQIQSASSYALSLPLTISDLNGLQGRLDIELGEMQASHRSLLDDQNFLNQQHLTSSDPNAARPIPAVLIATHEETVRVCEENIIIASATNILLLAMIKALGSIVWEGCDFANCHEMVKALAVGQGLHLYNQPTPSNLAVLYSLPLGLEFAKDLNKLVQKASEDSLISMLQELHQNHLPFSDEMDHICAKIVISKLSETFLSNNCCVWEAILKFGIDRGTIPRDFEKQVPYAWHHSVNLSWNRLYLRVLLCDKSNRMPLLPGDRHDAHPFSSQRLVGETGRGTGVPNPRGTEQY